MKSFYKKFPSVYGVFWSLNNDSGSSSSSKNFQQTLKLNFILNEKVRKNPHLFEDYESK